MLTTYLLFLSLTGASAEVDLRVPEPRGTNDGVAFPWGKGPKKRVPQHKNGDDAAPSKLRSNELLPLSGEREGGEGLRCVEDRRRHVSMSHQRMSNKSNGN